MLDVKELIKVRDALNVLIAWRGGEAEEEDGIVHSRDNKVFKLEPLTEDEPFLRVKSRAKPKSPTLPESWQVRTPASSLPKATRIIKETIYAALCRGPMSRKALTGVCREALPASAMNDMANHNGRPKWSNALTSLLWNLKIGGKVVEHNDIFELAKEKK